jgi:CRISPR-associated endonuclease/helicase Cas3
MNEIKQAYQKLLKQGFEPYDYQIKVAKALLAGKNVILSVPTGAGKTWASIIPFLMARENADLKGVFPNKMIYSLPLRTLANSIYEDVVKVLIDNGYDEEEIKRQTGEYSEDPNFEKDIIFSTIDQTLSNFLCFPLPLSQGQANINAGSLIGSYLVFDEFHLLDEKLSMATTIGTLKLLGNLCRCCIMTATLSDGFMDKLKNELGESFEIITLDDFKEDKSKIQSLLPIKYKKILQIQKNSITYNSIIENHSDKSIVICNRIENAQKIYSDLKIVKEQTTNPFFKETEIICLHSHFFDNDRKEKEQRLKKVFGKGTPKGNTILIATQVIEAGMDISCSRMHTEISPISSFLQRAGRCARFANEEGKIFIYPILNYEEKELLNIELEKLSDEDKKEIKKLKSKYLPYEKLICEETLAELQNLDIKTLDGDIPKNLVEKIYSQKEDQIFTNMYDAKFNQEKIRSAWSDCKKNNYRDTIRDIQSVEVVIIDMNQISEIARCPFIYQSIGVFKWSLVGWLNRIVKEITFDEEDTLVWALKEKDDNFLENDENDKFELKPVPIHEFNTIPAQVYINNKYFGYDAGLGLNWKFKDNSVCTSPKKVVEKEEEEFKPFKKDTFFQHNMGLIGCFEKEFANKIDFASAEITKKIGKYDWTKQHIEELIKLMIVLHDYGKLNDRWQSPMRKYQAKKEGIALADFTDILAHTDYDKTKPEDIALEKECELRKRGSHAGVGAFVAESLIEDVFDSEDIAYSVSMAIARHHSSLADSYEKFNISEQNYRAMQELLNKFNFDYELPKKREFGRKLNGLETDEQYLLYLFLVRILRLCDQKATKTLSDYYP